MIKPPKSEEEVIIWRDLISKGIDDGGGGIDPNDFVKKAGDTMLGQLKGIAPVAAEDLTRMDYVNAYHIMTNGSGGVVQLSDNTNLDDVTNTGFYDVPNAINRPPAGEWIYLQVMTHSNTSNFCRQVAWEFYGGGNRVWSRTKDNSTWSAWVEIGGGAGVKIFADVTFNPAGSILFGHNVSGIVDHGTGHWDVNFATAGTTNEMVCSATPDTGNELFGHVRNRITTSAGVECWNAADNSSLRDPSAMCFMAIN